MTTRTLGSGQDYLFLAENDEDGSDHGAGVSLENIFEQDEPPLICNESAALPRRLQPPRKAAGSQWKSYVPTDPTLHVSLI